MLSEPVTRMCSTESVSVDSSSGGGGHEPAMSSPTVGKLTDPNNNHQRNPNRRSNKPIMEKRRRARINNCLNELKGILLEAMRKDPARHSKLEKADILELTVSHLKSLHRSEAQAPPSASELLARYRAGFVECASEVGRFLTSPKAEGIDPSSTARLIAHLNDCLANTPGMGGQGSIPSPCSRTTPIPMLSNVSSNGPLSSCSGEMPSSLNGGQLHSNTPIISLLPSRLPSGEIAFVVPGFTSLRNGIQIHSSASLAPSAHHGHTHQSVHYQPLMSPDVPLELTVSAGHGHHHGIHGGSTSSPTSSTSSLSPAYSYAPIAHAHHSSSFYHHGQPAYQSQQPLALVTPRRDMTDMSCWRPW